MAAKPVLVVGSLAFDSIATPAGKADRVLGGSANYFSLSAAFFTKVMTVGVVGDDFPADHLTWMGTRGVDVRGVQRVPGKTFHWTGEYGKDLNEAITLSTQLNVFEHFDPQIPEEYKNAEYVFLGNIAPELQLSVLRQVRAPKFVALDSMNFWISGRRDALIEVLPKVQLLTINEGEAKMLGGNSNVVMAAEKILTMGPKVVVVKRGEYGAFLFTGKEIFAAPAVPIRRVTDPTGAGDTFAGGLVGYMAKEDAGLDPKALRQAVLFGAVMASFTVEEFSIERLRKLTAAEINERHNLLLRTMTP